MDILEKYFGIIAGAFAGLLLVLLIFKFGLIKTIIVVAFVTVGGYIGKLLDDKVGLRNYLSLLFRR